MNLEIEYGDFYKFITSLGLGLIGLAIFVPWLFLREPFDLLSKQSDINALTPIAQTIVENRQVLIWQIIQGIPWFSGISAVIGLALLFGGSTLWWRSQRILDRQQQANLDKLLKELEPATEQQIASKIREEIGKEDNVDTYILSATKIEKTIADKLKLCFSSRYEVLSNQRLNDIFFDVLFVAKDPYIKDCIIEIKYARKNVEFQTVFDGFLKIAHVKTEYSEQVNRFALGYFIVVMPENLLTKTNVQSYQQKLREPGSMFRKAKTYLVFVSEEELESLNCRRLKELLSLA